MEDSEDLFIRSQHEGFIPASEPRPATGGMLESVAGVGAP
jgi:hypothetical protein